MSLRLFILGLFTSFGIAWSAMVIVPFFKMRELAPVELSEVKDGATGIFYPKRTGRIANGAEVYAQNGCYHCHSQLVRPTYAGNDLFRPDWGGLKADPDRGDTRRETNAYDYFGEKFAQIGIARIGPDLSNIGLRVDALYAAPGQSPQQWFYAHLYNPRALPDHYKSNCPPFRFLFNSTEVKGNPATDAVADPQDPKKVLIPNSDCRALVSYLMSLKKDQSVPVALNFGPEKKTK
jgi:cytochrome c oxidase cbb3-type subunit II